MAGNYWRYMAQGGMGALNQMEDMAGSNDLPDPATLTTLETVSKRLAELCQRVRQAHRQQQAAPAAAGPPRSFGRQ